MYFSGPSDRGPLAEVREGMRVLDSRGDEVGKVDVAHMGNPEAVTDEGQPEVSPQGPIQALFPTGKQLPDEFSHRLARTGYLRISRSGIFSGTCYAGPDDINRVEADTVHLSTTQDTLIEPS